MVYDARNGIKAKQVFLSFTDAVQDNGSYILSGSQFTGNSLDLFWGAYYGDLTLNSVNYYMVDLGFDSTGASQSFGTNEYDVIASVATNVITMTAETSMTPDAHIGKYVIINKADNSKVYARITDNDASTLTLDQDVATVYGVAGSDTVALLKVPAGLTMTAWHRVDHIATDFELVPPSTETEDVYFLGTSDDSGSQNSSVDVQPPTKMEGSITVRGGVQDLLRLKFGQDSTSPTGRIRYNLGSESGARVGFIATWSTNLADMDNADAITKTVFCNDITITNIGLLDSVNSDGVAEATIEFEVKGSNVRVESISAQANNTSVNI